MRFGHPQLSFCVCVFFWVLIRCSVAALKPLFISIFQTTNFQVSGDISDKVYFDFFLGECILVLVWINPLLFRSPICKIRLVYCSNSLLSASLHLYFSDLQTFNSLVTFLARYTSPCSATKIMWCQTYTNIGTYIYCRANLNSRIIGCFNCCCCYWPTAAPIACLSWNYGLEMGLKQSLLIQDLLLEVRTHLAGNLILVSSLEIDFRFPGYVALSFKLPHHLVLKLISSNYKLISSNYTKTSKFI